MINMEVNKNSNDEQQLTTNIAVNGSFGDIIVELAAGNVAVLSRYTDDPEVKAAAVKSIGQIMFQLFGQIKQESELKPLDTEETNNETTD